MAVHIRLMRLGKKRRPYYRVVAMDSRKQRDSRYLESLGYYHPVEGDDAIKLDLEKYNEWVSKGAQPTQIVKDLARKMRKLNS